MAELRVSPVKLDGTVDTKYVLGKKGLLYNARSGKVGRPRSIDWHATANAVTDQSLEHIQERTNEAIDHIQRFYSEHPGYVDVRFRPIAVDGKPSNAFYLGPHGRLHDLRTDRPAVVLYDSPEAINWPRVNANQDTGISRRLNDRLNAFLDRVEAMEASVFKQTNIKLGHEAGEDSECDGQRIRCFVRLVIKFTAKQADADPARLRFNIIEGAAIAA